MKLNTYGNQPIITPRDPQVPMEAANKNYVDQQDNAHKADQTLHLTAEQNALLDGVTVTSTEINSLSNVTGNVQTQLDAKLNLAGGTLSGPLLLAADPAAALQAATKSYVDTKNALNLPKSGGTMTGALTLNADPTSALQAATKQYVDTGISTHADNADIHITPEQNTLLDALVVTSAEVNTLSGVTSSVQTQLNSKVAISGGTMTGPLILSEDPSANLGASTKQYTDANDALRVAKSGDTMTGDLTLFSDPTSALHASTKQYVDNTVSTHAANADIHITPEQNTLLDALTVTATEVNTLSGVTGNVQSQLDGKFDKAGGVVTGDITLAANKGVFVSKTPTDNTELVNKAYVDGIIRNLKWEDPVSDINLVDDTLNDPPVAPVAYDIYIVGATPTGAWVGKAGYAVFFNGTEWVALGNRAVISGDRFGVALTTSTVAGASLTAYAKKLVTVVTAAAGAMTYSVDTVAAGSTTLVFDNTAHDFGVTYTLSDSGNWIPTNTSVNLVPGAAMALNGNLLNLQYGKGFLINGSNAIELDLTSGGSLDFTQDGVNYSVGVKLDSTTLTSSNAGLKVSDLIISNVNDRISKSGTTVVTGTVQFQNGSSLQAAFTPMQDTDVVNKVYVDTADSVIQGQVTTLQGTVATLNTDPVTKTYVDDVDVTKVNKSGDTMTGALTLNGDPTSALHASTKQYVDAGISTHATNDSLHLTTGQNALLDALTVTSTEINTLSGISGNVQTALDAKLNLSGGTLTGSLTLSGDPLDVLQPTTKQYVDAIDVRKANLSGATFTGAVVLNADPTALLQAATKQYVDTGLSTHISDNSLHLTSTQNTFLDGITVSYSEVNELSGITDNVQNQIDSKLNLTGGTLTGPLTLSGVPTVAAQAANKSYVDSQAALKLNLSGGTMTGFITLNADPVSDLHSATKAYVDTSAATTKTYVDNQDATKVSKSGDTMTGFLTLNADPVSALHSVTKQYVDAGVVTTKTYIDAQDVVIQEQVTALQSTVTTLNSDPVTKTYVDANDSLKLPKSGGTMTGYISLHADPQQAMHPATKQYVDAIAQGLSTKPEVRLASTENIAGVYDNGTSGVNSTLTGSANGAIVVDTITPIVGDRILLKKQTSKLENGDYTVQQVGDASTPFILKRVPTIDESSEVPGSFFFVYDGTLKGTGWTFNVANPVTFSIGVDDIDVNQFSGQGSLIFGNGGTLDGNTLNINTASSSRIVVNSDNIDLAVTSVTPGTYTRIQVDGYGRAVNGTNPNTIAGYGITDAQPLNANLTSMSDVATYGIVVRDNTNTVVTKAVTTSGLGISTSNGNGASSGDIVVQSNATAASTPDTIVYRDSSGNFSANVVTATLTGNATTATTLATARTITIDGDVTAPATAFNGGANITLNTTMSATGVTAGTYNRVTVAADGRIVFGDNPTTVSELGLIDAATIDYVNAQITNLQQQFYDLYNYVMTRV